jgi:hypothetical protein
MISKNLSSYHWNGKTLYVADVERNKVFRLDVDGITSDANGRKTVNGLLNMGLNVVRAEFDLTYLNQRDIFILQREAAVWLKSERNKRNR